MQELEMMREQNSLLRGILEKEFGITDDDIGRSARRYARDYFNQTKIYGFMNEDEVNTLALKYPNAKGKAIKELREQTGISLKEATKMMDKAYAVTKCCPKCGGKNYHAFIDEVILREGKTKTKTSLNLNPLKPFTLFNHKEKVVRQPVTMQVSKFVCDDCGKIFS